MEGPGAGLLRCCELRVDRFDGDDMVAVLCLSGVVSFVVLQYFDGCITDSGQVLELVLCWVVVLRCCVDDREDLEWDRAAEVGGEGEEKRSTRKIAFTPTTLRVGRGPRVAH